MSLSQYQDKPVRVTMTGGYVTEGIADTYPAGYGLHEFDRDEESIRLNGTYYFESGIRSVEVLPMEASSWMRSHGKVITPLEGDFSACRLKDGSAVDLSRPFTYFSCTDEECSLICRTEDVPENTEKREDGYKAFRVAGPLDFNLIGVLARITEILAQEDIGILAVSTYDTDYILVKEEDYRKALLALYEEEFEVENFSI